MTHDAPSVRAQERVHELEGAAVQRHALLQPQRVRVLVDGEPRSGMASCVFMCFETFFLVVIFQNVLGMRSLTSPSLRIFVFSFLLILNNFRILVIVDVVEVLG